MIKIALFSLTEWSVINTYTYKYVWHTGCLTYNGWSTWMSGIIWKIRWVFKVCDLKVFWEEYVLCKGDELFLGILGNVVIFGPAQMLI